MQAYLWSLRLDLSGTGERAVHLTHVGGVVGCDFSELVANAVLVVLHYALRPSSGGRMGILEGSEGFGGA